MIKNLNIGGVVYTVEELPRLLAANADGSERYVSGHIQFHLCRIRVDSEDAEQLKPHIVMHEAVHGILHHAGIDDHPENMVVALGYGLVALLRDNPEFVQWIMRGNAPGLSDAVIKAREKL